MVRRLFVVVVVVVVVIVVAGVSVIVVVGLRASDGTNVLLLPCWELLLDVYVPKIVCDVPLMSMVKIQNHAVLLFKSLIPLSIR